MLPWNNVSIIQKMNDCNWCCQISPETKENSNLATLTSPCCNCCSQKHGKFEKNVWLSLLFFFYKKEPVNEWMTAFGVEKLTQHLWKRWRLQKLASKKPSTIEKKKKKITASGLLIMTVSVEMYDCKCSYKTNTVPILEPSWNKETQYS